MGLDVSHGCWEGPYSAFDRWRSALNYYLGNDASGGTTHEAYMGALDRGVYDDQSVPINVLMGHSDCDGEIEAAVCGPLADALEALLTKMPERALYDIHRPATLRFITGLRLAAAAGETVEFG